MTAVAERRNEEERSVKAKDIMTRKVVTVTPDTEVREVARLLTERRISAVPVVDEQGRVLGIVSEGDLVRRPELGTERHPSWWLRLFLSPEDQAREFVKSHGHRARDVMTRDPVTVDEEASLEDIAELLETRHIKRVPVVHEGRLVGIVSRADLLRALASRKAAPEPRADDRTLRDRIERALEEAGVRHEFMSVMVSGGVAHLWGIVDTPEEREAARVAAESVPGVREVRVRLNILPPGTRALIGAE